MARKKSARPGTPEAREDDQARIQQAVVNTANVMEIPIEEAEDRLLEHLANVEDHKEEVAEEVEQTRLTVTQRCEEAKETSCSCRCRGRYHAKPHPEGWKDEVGCEPLTKEERKVAHREALKQWRRAHPDRVKAYMKGWFATSEAPTAQANRTGKAKKFNTISRANAAKEEAEKEIGNA